jgi:hypothetical protein
VLFRSRRLSLLIMPMASADIMLVMAADLTQHNLGLDDSRYHAQPHPIFAVLV